MVKKISPGSLRLGYGLEEALPKPVPTLAIIQVVEGYYDAWSELLMINPCP
jgi:hypothetical protein